MRVKLLLDRDFRNDAEIDLIEKQLAAAEVDAHIWRRKEIENYALDPSAIASVSGATPAQVTTMLTDVAGELRDYVEGQLVAHALQCAPRGIDPATTTTETLADVRNRWTDAGQRIALIPGKKAISMLNDRLQKGGFRTVTARKIAGRLDPEEIPELLSTLKDIDDALR